MISSDELKGETDDSSPKSSRSSSAVDPRETEGDGQMDSKRTSSASSKTKRASLDESDRDEGSHSLAHRRPHTRGRSRSRSTLHRQDDGSGGGSDIHVHGFSIPRAMYHKHIVYECERFECEMPHVAREGRSSAITGYKERFKKGDEGIYLSHKHVLSRHNVIVATVSGFPRKMIVWTYNWNSSLVDSLNDKMNQIVSWHLSRHALCENILHQKMGLFHHSIANGPRVTIHRNLDSDAGGVTADTTILASVTNANSKGITIRSIQDSEQDAKGGIQKTMAKSSTASRTANTASSFKKASANNNALASKSLASSSASLSHIDSGTGKHCIFVIQFHYSLDAQSIECVYTKNISQF